MRIKRPLIVAALAASLVAVGGTAASAATTSPQHFVQGQEYFVLWTHSPSTLPVYQAVDYGVYNAFGVDVTVSSTPTQVVLVAYRPGASFWVYAQENGTSQTSANPNSCVVTYTSYGNTYQVTHGTGRLWGLFGWGTYSIYAVQTFPRSYPNGPCNFNAPAPVPGTSFTIIHGHGPVFLPRPY